jgi:NAD+ kinase
MLAPDGPFPTTFGPYRVLRHLGRGGMGDVYLAREGDRDIALKVPQPRVLRDDTLRQHFIEEGRIALRLPHDPYLCLVYACGEVDGLPYLAMEYLPGGPLRPVAVRDVWEAVALVHTLALAMQRAHEVGVTHRDLKPSNILFRPSSGGGPRPVITDFGLGLRLYSPDALMPQPGEVVGSTGYIAPEQFEHGPATGGVSCDIFSLGVILYELLTGRLPFPGPSLMDFLVQVVSDTPLPPSRHRPGLAPVLDQLCLKVLARDPSQRYRSMREFADELSRALHDVNAAALPTPATAQPQAIPRVSPECLRLVFAGFGTTAQEFSRPQDHLFLDVGNALGPGVIDHHHLITAVGSTASLVLGRPHLIAAAVRPDRPPDAPFTVVLHEQPDLDCVASCFLARAYLADGAFPPEAPLLARYLDRLDQGHSVFSPANPFTLGAAYRQLSARLTQRRFGNKQTRWQEAVLGGLQLIDFVLARVGDQPIDAVDAFACPEVMKEEDRLAVESDRGRYEQKMTDPRTRARKAWLSLPGQFGGRGQAPALLVRDVQSPFDPDRCVFFRDWARTDTRRCPQDRGFVALSVFQSEGPGCVRRCILSVRPESELCLRGLGERLDQAEAEARRRLFGLDDRVIDPVSLHPLRPRPGYTNADPWYDGRAHAYTIVDAPRHGTCLTADEIETLFLTFCQVREIESLPTPLAEVPSPVLPPVSREKKLALSWSGFDPPGQSHRRLAEELLQRGFEVVVVPTGPPPDQTSSAHVASIHRAVLADLGFRNLPGVRVDLTDLDNGIRSSPETLSQRFAAEGEVWHVLMPDQAAPSMPDAARCIRVTAPADVPAATTDRLLTLPLEGYVSSSELRDRLYRNPLAAESLNPEVAAYIRRHGLFTGALPPSETIARFGPSRLLIVADEHNPLAQNLRREYEHWSSPDPELILVLGGDGTMLRAIWEHWRMRIPFFGLNLGHLGFLMNESLPEDFPGELLLYRLPMLRVDVEAPETGLGAGRRCTGLAFADAWVEREGGQAAWLQIAINGEVRVPRLVADGVLVATTSGTSAYARAMGATPVPLGAPVLTLVASNVFHPSILKPVVLPDTATITLTALDGTGKRSLRGFLDGRPVGPIREMTIRTSAVAGVELAFGRGSDPTVKLLHSLFPPQLGVEQVPVGERNVLRSPGPD